MNIWCNPSPNAVALRLEATTLRDLFKKPTVSVSIHNYANPAAEVQEIFQT
jgi:hypothetical protein